MKKHEKMRKNEKKYQKKIFQRKPLKTYLDMKKMKKNIKKNFQEKNEQ